MAVDLVFTRFLSKGITAQSTPVSILHGMFGSKTNWRSLGKKLMLESNRPIYCMDARNHGDSPHTPEMSYELMSEDLVQFMKTQNIRKSFIVGHSMGGKTAMVFALKYPHLVQGLIVVDIAPVASSDGASDIMHNIEIMKMLDLSKVKYRRDADNLLKTQIQDSVLRGFLVSGLSINGIARWKNNLQAIENNMHLLSDFPTLCSAQPYTGPTLFIGGSKSHYISQDSVPVIHRLFPNALVHYIQGAGHWLHHEKPDDFKEITKKFLSTHS